MASMGKIRNSYRILVSKPQGKRPTGREKFIRELKVKLSLYLTKHHAMNKYWGTAGTAPCILNLGTRWM